MLGGISRRKPSRWTAPPAARQLNGKLQFSFSVYANALSRRLVVHFFQLIFARRYARAVTEITVMRITYREILAELEERVVQAMHLLVAVEQAPQSKRDANAMSRAKYLGEEIEKLSADAEIERLNELIEANEN